MTFIIKVIKGMLVGVGSITPGVSGSMIAASFNIYEEIIDALNSFSKKPFRAILDIWEYLVGIILGILFGAVVVVKLMAIIPLHISFFFIGLVIGSLPAVVKEERNSKIKWYHILIMLIAISLILLLLLVEPISINALTGFKAYLAYVLIGFFIAVPLIIPGLSGATVLLVLGLYTVFAEKLTSLFEHFTTFNFSGFMGTFLPVLIMAVSAFVGLLLFAKVIKYILNNHKTGFNMAIIGLLLVAPVSIVDETNSSYENVFNNLKFFEIFMIIIAFGLGFVVTYLKSIKKDGAVVEK